MKLPHHNRYEYRSIKNRADYSWPNGKRLALYFGINIEHFSFAQGMRHAISTQQVPPDPRTFSWLDYGNRVGVWRLFDLFDDLKLPACHLINTTVFDYAPDIVEAIRARGDEIIGHGRTNAEKQGDMWEEDEARFLGYIHDKIRTHGGSAPRGWMAPWMSQSAVTPDLLDETGFRFAMDWPFDDQPIWMRTRNGRLLSMPYPLEINDSPQIVVQKHTGEQFAQSIIDQFDEMIEQSEKQPLVCGIALHTMVVGQPFRLRALRRALQHIVSHPLFDRVWLTRPGAIYDHCCSLPEGVIPGSEYPSREGS
jgi:peptidoglycan/xylan/chitin deacetylase (PgdA/CDA1 family)